MLKNIYPVNVGRSGTGADFNANATIGTLLRSYTFLTDALIVGVRLSSSIGVIPSTIGVSAFAWKFFIAESSNTTINLNDALTVNNAPNNGIWDIHYYANAMQSSSNDPVYFSRNTGMSFNENEGIFMRAGSVVSLYGAGNITTVGYSAGMVLYYTFIK